MKKVYVVLYKNFTALDVFGAVEVLSSIDDYEIHYVSQNGGIVENSQAIRIETELMTSIEKNNIILIPGGFGSRTEIENENFISSLANIIEISEYVLCVCTGSAWAAKTGALNNKHATSNKKAFEWVKSCNLSVIWNKKARWVVDGKFYTSAGVSAGIDMAVGFVRDIYGEEKAKEICARMEYHWNSDAENDTF